MNNELLLSKIAELKDLPQTKENKLNIQQLQQEIR